MVLLKATQFAGNAVRKEIFNLNDIAAEAQAILENARQEREKILAQTRQEIAKMRKLAKEEGYQKGNEEGLVEGRKQGYRDQLAQTQKEFEESGASLMQSLETVFQYFEEAKEQLLWQAEQGTVALVISIAEKVIKRKGELCLEVASENVKAALSYLSPSTDVLVKLNPKNYEHLTLVAGKNESQWKEYTHLRFESDEGIEPGGCRMMTANGEIDARLETQIQQIANELLLKNKSAAQE